MINHVCELCNKTIFLWYMHTDRTFVMSTNYWLHQLSKTLHWAGSTVDRCWERSCDWCVAVGVSAFRKELSAEAQIGVGTVASEKKPSSVIPRGVAVQSQGGGMPYMLISTQIRLVRIMHLWISRVMLLGKTRSSYSVRDLFIWLRNIAHASNQSRSSLADYSHAVAIFYMLELTNS